MFFQRNINNIWINSHLCTVRKYMKVYCLIAIVCTTSWIAMKYPISWNFANSSTKIASLTSLISRTGYDYIYSFAFHSFPLPSPPLSLSLSFSLTIDIAIASYYLCLRPYTCTNIHHHHSLHSWTKGWKNSHRHHQRQKTLSNRILRRSPNDYWKGRTRRWLAGTTHILMYLYSFLYLFFVYCCSCSC